MQIYGSVSKKYLSKLVKVILRNSVIVSLTRKDFFHRFRKLNLDTETNLEFFMLKGKPSSKTYSYDNILLRNYVSYSRFFFAFILRKPLILFLPGKQQKIYLTKFISCPFKTSIPPSHASHSHQIERFICNASFVANVIAVSFFFTSGFMHIYVIINVKCYLQNDKSCEIWLKFFLAKFFLSPLPQPTF